MLQLPFDHMPGNVAQVLLYRGGSLMPLCWFTTQDRNGKLQLDQLDDKQLFSKHGVNDPTGASLVRALLYLWTGWPDEAQIFAGEAPQKDQMYLSALCARHGKELNESKVLLSQMDGHSIYEDLIEPTKSIAGFCGDKQVKRMADLMELDARWEPFAFTDSWALADDQQLTQGGIEAVRKLQQVEFNLLLRHAYIAATGVDLREFVGKSAKRDTPRRRPTRTTPQRHRQRQAAVEAKKGTEQAAKPIGDVHVICPKCNHARRLSGEMCGRVTNCPNCHAAFLVPDGAPRAEKPGPAAGSGAQTFKVACPKCGGVNICDQSMRGQVAQCRSCGASYRVAAARATAHG